MHVGQITIAYDRTITETVYTPPQPLSAGGKLGTFHRANSVIVLFALGIGSGAVPPLRGRWVHMVESLGTHG